MSRDSIFLFEYDTELILSDEKFNLQLTQQQYEVFGNFIVEYVTNKMKVDYDMEVKAKQKLFRRSAVLILNPRKYSCQQTLLQPSHKLIFI